MKAGGEEGTLIVRAGERGRGSGSGGGEGRMAGRGGGGAEKCGWGAWPDPGVPQEPLSADPGQHAGGLTSLKFEEKKSPALE